MKSVSEHTVIQSAYKEAGILRGAAAICGTTHKTVKRILEAAERAEAGVAVRRERNFDGAREVVAGKIDTCQGRISAKRLLVLARAAGYQGSARNFRRLVAEVNATLHSEIQEVPLERLVRESELLSGLPALGREIAKREWRKVDRLSCVRFGSARCSVPVSGAHFAGGPTCGGVPQSPRSHPETMSSTGRPLSARPKATLQRLRTWSTRWPSTPLRRRLSIPAGHHLRVAAKRESEALRARL